MYDVTKLFENTTGLPTPLVKANKLWVAELEKLVNFQLKMVQSYVDIGINQLKAAAEIEDVKGWQEFVNGQVEVANALRQKVMDDAKALADLGASFRADFEALAKESAANLVPKAA